MSGKKSLVNNLLYARPPCTLLPPPSASSEGPLSLMECTLFGPQFKRRPSSTPQSPSASSSTRSAAPAGNIPADLELSDAVCLSNSSSSGNNNNGSVDKLDADRRVVSSAKRAEEAGRRAKDGAARRSLLLKHGRSTTELFQYKHYDQQTPLQLTREEIDQVVSTVVHPPKEDAANSRLVASQILLKLLMDVYVVSTREDGPSFQILSLLLEMIEPDMPVDTRTHAFNLLFNLAMHLSLLEEADQTATAASSSNGGGSGSSAAPAPATLLQGQSGRIRLLQDDLFLKLREMLLWLVYNDEADGTVWMHAFHCLLYFVFADGEIDRTRAITLDPRVVVALLQHLRPFSSTTEGVLVRLLACALYPTGAESLQVELLQRSCTINQIVDAYLHSRSFEAQENLLVIIFDYIAAAMAKRKQGPAVNSDQLAIIFELLRRFDAAIALPRIFRFCPDKFVEQFVKFVFFEKLKPTMAQLTVRLDKALVVAFLFDFVKLAQSPWQLEKEFDVLLQRTLTTSEFTDHDARCLRALLSSAAPSDRNNGDAWLFALLRADIDGAVVPKDAVQAILIALLSAPNAETRAVYFSVVEKLVLYQKSRLGAAVAAAGAAGSTGTLSNNPTSPSAAPMSPMSPNGAAATATGGGEADGGVLAAAANSRLNAVFATLNEYLAHAVTAQEKNEANLLHLFDIVFHTIGMAARSSRSRGTESVQAVADSAHELFLLGEFYVPASLLQLVNISLLLHLFSHLPSHRADVRLVVLMLMTEKIAAKPALLESIGGLDFFKLQLNAKDAAIVLQSARFLLSVYQVQRKGEFAKLTQQMAGDANLRGNQYLQVLFIHNLMHPQQQ